MMVTKVSLWCYVDSWGGCACRGAEGTVRYMGTSLTFHSILLMLFSQIDWGDGFWEENPRGEGPFSSYHILSRVHAVSMTSHRCFQGPVTKIDNLHRPRRKSLSTKSRHCPGPRFCYSITIQNAGGVTPEPRVSPSPGCRIKTL